MEQNKKGGIKRNLVVALILLTAVAAAETLCALFAPAGALLPVSLGSLAVIGLVSAYTYIAMQKKVFQRLDELRATAADIAAGNFRESTPVYDETDAMGDLSKSLSAVMKKSQRFGGVIRKIAEGDLEPDTDRSDSTGAMSEGFEAVVANLNRLVSDVDALSGAAVEGRIEARLDADSYPGAYGVIARDFNATLDAITGPLQAGIANLQKISEGVDPGYIEDNYMGEYKDFVEDLNKTRDIMLEMVVQTRKLVEASKEGDLVYRADSSALKGGFKEVVEGVNDTLDAILTPINEAEDVLKRMSLNDYSKKMSEGYKGSLKEMADCINDVHGRLLSILDVMLKLSKGDTSRLEEFQGVGKRSEQDALIPAIIKTMETIRSLIDETGSLAQAAYNGDLSVRGNVDKFEGAYKEIIGGLNKTLQAVAEPIMECAKVMQEVASGNLTVEMAGEYQGEYNKIKESINNTIDAFNGILRDISVASAQVSSGAKQVSESSVALSQGATEQASSVEELTASIEQIAVQTEQNAKDASHANTLAESAKGNAEKGNQQMKSMLKSMEEINVSSNNISRIIKVIDDIAFQTNILALNAAVEAARAGQHGKGFTVVAEEVRNLAARSAKAANETTDLIKNSMRNVEEGTAIANETAGALNEIVEGVAEAAHLVHNIANASGEQSAAIAQVNQGIMQVSQVVQSNSATSEESAAASEELASQAEVLREQIEKFRLKEEINGRHFEELTPEAIRRLETLFEKNRVVADSPPKPAEGGEELFEVNSKY